MFGAKKLEYLIDQDIIERVEEPSPWVSPIVPILKDSGEIRLCVDMRRANNAVLRETHPLPIVEDDFDFCCCWVNEINEMLNSENDFFFLILTDTNG